MLCSLLVVLSFLSTGLLLQFLCFIPCNKLLTNVFSRVQIIIGIILITLRSICQWYVSGTISGNLYKYDLIPLFPNYSICHYPLPSLRNGLSWFGKIRFVFVSCNLVKSPSTVLCQLSASTTTVLPLSTALVLSFYKVFKSPPLTEANKKDNPEEGSFVIPFYRIRDLRHFYVDKGL